MFGFSREDAGGNRHEIEVAPVVMGLRAPAEPSGEPTRVPVILASALKGVVRAWLENHVSGIERKSFLESFGFQKEATPDHNAEGEGAKVEFLDAFMKPPAIALQAEPYQSADRTTQVAVNVAIDRRTRTASDEKLVHAEYVPTDREFEVEIRGILTEEEVRFLLKGLAALSTGDVDRPTLGAGGASGWGLVQWHLTALRQFTQDHLEEALANWRTNLGSFPNPYQAAVARGDFAAWAEAATEAAQHAAAGDVNRLVLEFTLALDGPFGVNDHTRAGRASEGRNNLEPMRVAGNPGEYRLPATSMRGVLRSQCERILRTMCANRLAAWPADQPKLPGGPIFEDAKKLKIDLGLLDPVARLFGWAGWATTVRIDDFTGPEPPRPARPGGAAEPQSPQEMIAIDRFTGGGAESAKFKVAFAWRPKLEGRITVDLGRLRLAENGESSLALLAFALRDLHEGDIAVGYGASKGYGTASIEEFTVTGGTPEVRAVFKLLAVDVPPPAATETLSAWCTTVVEHGNQFAAAHAG